MCLGLVIFDLNRLKKRVAMKILTGDAGSGSTKLDEVPILERIKSARPNHPSLKNIAGMLDHFTHRGPNGEHICMTFDVLGDSVTSLRKYFPGRVIPVNLIQRITYQNGGSQNTSVKHLYTRNHLLIRRVTRQNYIYESQPLPTTLESFDRQEDIDVKLADYGTCIWEDQDHPVKVIQTPALRAPEVILRAPWKTSADIWALASVIFNLYSSKWLFMPIPCEDPELTAEEDHIVQMITMLGDFPLDFIKSGKSSGEFFNLNDGSLLKYKIPPEFMTSLDAVVLDFAPPGAQDDELKGITDFLRPMLKVAPQERAIARELLNHSWLRDFRPA
ncbi:kinase-like domain-containing protein [Abortiporus biennis]|nr:kinase-like domain-containing protein [Abortiporus biennis]